MALIYKVLGQTITGGSFIGNILYTSPVGGTAVSSTLSICNLNSSNCTYSIAIVPSGQTLSAKHSIASNTEIKSKETIALSLGITLGSNDSIIVNSSNSNLSFNLFGSLSTPNNYGSLLFNSTPSQYLSIPNNIAFAQDVPFTYEGWVYPTSLTSNYIFIMLQHNFIGLAYRDGTFKLDMSYVGNPPGYSTLNTACPINNWYHVALTWTGTAGYLFINGNQEATFSGAGGTVSDGNPLYIGQYQDQSFASFQGYLSNFRVVRGNALYTAPFTPPTSPLNNVANTTLLLNTDAYSKNFLKDSSINNFTVTNNGNITSTILNPF